MKKKSKKSPKQADVEAAVLRYLGSRHFTLWANWDISKEDRRAEAAKWAAEQYLAIHAELVAAS